MAVFGGLLVGPSCVISARFVDCTPGTFVEEGELLYCLYCLDHGACPADTPFFVVTEDGVACSSGDLSGNQLPLSVKSLLERRCAGAHDAGATVCPDSGAAAETGAADAADEACSAQGMP